MRVLLLQLRRGEPQSAQFRSWVGKSSCGRPASWGLRRAGGVRSGVRRPPFSHGLREVESVVHGEDVGALDERGVALQVARQLDRAGAGAADDGQQHLDDQRGVEIDAAGHAVEAVLSLALGDWAVRGEVDEDAVQGLALDEFAAQGGEQEGADGDVQEGAELLVGPAGLGLADEAGDGAGQGAVAGEAGGADREQAEAVEALRVEEGVEAAVAVVAAQVVDLAEVAEGGGAGGSVEDLLELGEGERLRSGKSIGEEGGGAPGHVRIV